MPPPINIMTLTKLKVSLKKLLPPGFIDHLERVWSFMGRPLMASLTQRRLRGFQGITIKAVTFRGQSFKLLLNPANGFLDTYIFSVGIYEDYILDLIHNNIPRGGVFFDVGANIGLHSVFAAKCLQGSTGRVYAFEPVPSLREQLQASLALNNLSNVKVFPYALGDSNASSEIYFSNCNMGHSTLMPSSDVNQVLRVEIKKLDCEFESLDRLDLMKIDVEGYEYSVLVGAGKTIQKYRPVILLEFSPSTYEVFDTNLPGLILDFLMPLYLVYDVDDGMKLLLDKQQYLSNFSSRNRNQTNFFCTPR